jgi:hypothetical protein
MQVTTGGSDSTIATGGVVLNMVTKRGTNEWRGTARYYLTDQDYQSDLEFNEGDLGQAGAWNGNRAQTSFKQGNRIVSVEDYGGEIGGPIVRDRLWIWGSYGLQEVDLLTIADVSDFTELETFNLKLNAQITPANSATFFALNSDKVKIGRNAGPTRPQQTTWNQSKFGDDPTAAKIEDTHIFSSNFYLTGLYSIVNGGFQLDPQGGLGSTAFLDSGGVWRNTFQLYQTERPQEQYRADASNFFNTGSVSHELKFGAGYREAEVTTLSRWGGAGYILDAVSAGTDFDLLVASRDAGPSIIQDYTSAYVQDTLTIGNLTANLGLRYDLQGGENLDRTVRANPLLPNVLPSVSYQGGDIGFEWETITPRLGLTYALGAERKTLLRASYSRFADQMGTGVGSQLNPLGLQSYGYFYVNDAAGTTGNVGLGNFLFSNTNPDLGFSGNVNPFTGGLLQSNAVSSDINAPLTDELLLGVEHALLPEFVVGVNLTYRLITDILESELLVFDSDPYSPANLNSVGRPHRRDDYVQINGSRTLPDGTVRNFSYFQLRPGVFTRNGSLLENGDLEQEYLGASLVFNKRLANRWMLRGNFSWSDWEWSSVPASELENPTDFLGGGEREGDPVLQGSGTGSGAKGGIYINSEWSYSVNGLYQIAPDRPWGFNVALNLNGRQGYPIPYFVRVLTGPNQQFAAYTLQLTDSPDEFRLDDIHMVDARVEKEFTFSDFGFTLGVDVFNVFNESYILQRNHRIGQTTSDHVREISSPRVVRFGARLSFR